MDITLNIFVWIAATIVIGVLISLVYMFNKYRNPEMNYTVACAGTEYKDEAIDNQKAQIERNSIYTNFFVDNEGNRIDVNNYRPFIVKGNSMSLSGIYDGDLILTSRNFKLDKGLFFPDIYVIKRFKKKGDVIDFKLRRGWKIIDDISKISESEEKTTFEDILKDILSSPQFSKLKKMAEKAHIKEMDDKKMISDFFKTRLKEYKERYLKNGKYDAKAKSILISTTLHTKDNEILFSIHPASNIIGKLKYCYRLTNPVVKAS